MMSDNDRLHLSIPITISLSPSSFICLTMIGFISLSPSPSLYPHHHPSIPIIIHLSNNDRLHLSIPITIPLSPSSFICLTMIGFISLPPSPSLYPHHHLSITMSNNDRLHLSGRLGMSVGLSFMIGPVVGASLITNYSHAILSAICSVLLSAGKS